MALDFIKPDLRFMPGRGGLVGAFDPAQQQPNALRLLAQMQPAPSASFPGQAPQAMPQAPAQQPPQAAQPAARSLGPAMTPNAAPASPQAGGGSTYMMSGGLGDFLRSNPTMISNLAAGLMSGSRAGVANAVANLPNAQQRDRQNAALKQWMGTLPEEQQGLARAFPQVAGQSALQAMFAQPAERRILEDATGRKRYADDGSYVFGDLPVGAGPALKPADQFKMERDLRKDFDSLTGDFRTVRDAHARIGTSAAQDSPAGDLSMIFNYMKMLDPGSVVRESEFATAASARPLLEQLGVSWDAVKTVWEGQRLTPGQRADFVNVANDLYDAQRSDFEIRRDEYQGIASQYGLVPDRVVSDRDYSPQETLPSGVTEDDIQETMRANGMSREEVLKAIGEL